MIHPKICPEPSLRESYKGWTQYKLLYTDPVLLRFNKDILKGMNGYRERAYYFSVNRRGIIVIAHSIFKKCLNTHISKFKSYCKDKNIKLKLIADEEKEIWNL